MNINLALILRVVKSGNCEFVFHHGDTEDTEEVFIEVRYDRVYS